MYINVNEHFDLKILKCFQKKGFFFQSTFYFIEEMLSYWIIFFHTFTLSPVWKKIDIFNEMFFHRSEHLSEKYVLVQNT